MKLPTAQGIILLLSTRRRGVPPPQPSDKYRGASVEWKRHAKAVFDAAVDVLTSASPNTAALHHAQGEADAQFGGGLGSPSEEGVSLAWSAVMGGHWDSTQRFLKGASK